MNGEVLGRVREKLKEGNFSEQELKAIESAKDKLESHTYTGGFVGASTAFLIGKRKRFNPIQLLALAGGGFIIGSQMGLISGALSGLKGIQALPNPERIINVMKEAQMEVMQGRPGANAGAGNNRPMVRPPQMSNRELHDAQSPQDQFSPDVNDNMAGERVWDDQPTYSNKQHNEIQTPVEAVPKKPQSSAWDKIRSENLPNTTWSKIRHEAQKHPDNVVEIEKNKAARANRLRENGDFGDNVDEMPRTREEALERGTGRKNQWGDPLE